MLNMEESKVEAGEFKKGDVIAEIGGHLVYVVEFANQVFKWYCLKYVYLGEVLRTDADMDFVDKNFVKVDRCSSMGHISIYSKICKLRNSLVKGQDEELIVEGW